MSEEQLSAFLAASKADAGLQEKLKGVADLDSAVAIAKGAGFDVSKADWVKYQASQVLEMSDEELEGVAGGFFDEFPTLKESFVDIIIEMNMIKQRSYKEDMHRRFNSI